MDMKVAFVLALLAGASLQAQVQSPQNPAQTKPPAATAAPAPKQAPGAGTTQAARPAPRMLKPHAYVRRISFGATLTVQGLSTIKPGSVNHVTTTPPVDALYTSTNNSRRVGYGVTAQLALSERFALASGLYIRQIGYKLNTDTYLGVDDPSTPLIDERTYIVHNEDTRARVFDVPVLLRYYSKDRHEPGPRVFIELGGALRRTTNVSTWIDSSINSAPTTCCDFTPASVHKRTTPGAVAGFGVQILDPIGIRVVPEVRYTRWFNEPFHAFSNTTRRNQIEAIISLTF